MLVKMLGEMVDGMLKTGKMVYQVKEDHEVEKEKSGKELCSRICSATSLEATCPLSGSDPTTTYLLHIQSHIFSQDRVLLYDLT